MADGGKVGDKELGLSRSAGEKVGFWERIKMGNIDQEGSKANMAYGSGRGKAERQMDELDAGMASARAKPMADTMPTMDSERAGSRAVAGTPAPAPAPARSVPTKAVSATPSKPKTPTGSTGDGARAARAADRAASPNPAPAPARAADPAGATGRGARAARAADARAANPPASQTTSRRVAARSEQEARTKQLMEETEFKGTGIGPKNTMTARAYEEAEKRKTATNPTGSIYGMANGGLVGASDRRSYGKKC